MNRHIRYLSVPLHVWTHPDLTLEEKAVLIDIDSYCSDSNGTAIGTQALSGSTGLPVKTIKAALKSLQEKSAIEVRIDEDGAKRIIPYLWKERYISDPARVVIGDRPTDVMMLPYDEISRK